MSLENVRAFYQKLATDSDFQAKVQAAENKRECSRIVRAAGYFFTQQEFEEYTAELLESTAVEDNLKNLDEKELEAVVGGVKSVIGIKWPIAIAHYGVVWPKDDIWPVTKF